MILLHFIKSRTENIQKINVTKYVSFFICRYVNTLCLKKMLLNLKFRFDYLSSLYILKILIKRIFITLLLQCLYFVNKERYQKIILLLENVKFFHYDVNFIISLFYFQFHGHLMALLNF